MKHKLIMENWNNFLEEEKLLEARKISFYKSPPDKEFITEVLGIDLPLNESHTEYSQDIVEEIIREQILFEGFWDAIKDKAKEYGQGIADLFKSLKAVVSSGRLFKKFLRQLKMYVNRVKQNFMNFIQKVIEKVPSLESIMSKIQSVIQGAFEKVEGLGGWKGVLSISGIIVVFTYIQEKFGDLIKSVLGGEDDEGTIKTGIEQLKAYLLEKFNLASIADKIAGKLTDIKSYLGFLGPIVGGVKFVGDALGAITRPFIEKYFEEEGFKFDS